MNPWLSQNQRTLARDRRHQLLHMAARCAGLVLPPLLALCILIGIVRAAAITGANLPHTLEQAERLRAG